MVDESQEAQYELDVSDSPETEVDLSSGEEVVEETPQPEPEVPQAAQEDDSEHEEYSASVKKRINRLTKKMREAERQREEALRYAQQVQTESNQLRNRVQSLDHGYMTEYGNRLNVEQQAAEADYKKAIEIGDPDATLEAQKKLNQLSVAAAQYQQAQQAAQQQAQYQQYYAQQAAQQPQQPQQQAAPAQQEPDPKAQTWAEKNAWFGTDEAMTFAAFGIHKKLVEDEGFDPQSDEYYNEIDKRMRTEFPHKLNTGSDRRPAQTVVGASRTTKAGRSNSRRVKLSPTQVAIAKKLGVPLEEYAKYVKE